jgi:assimilatory nitrate reductase catalytic subunit
MFSASTRTFGIRERATRDFDLSGLANISDDAYLGLEPVQWPVRDQRGTGQARMLGDGRFYTTDGRARFVSVEEPRLAAQPDKTHAFLLNTGRVRDHWHTMTRTGKSPRLSAHIDEPFVEVHPDDAAAAGLADGDFAEVSSPHGKAMLRVRSSEGQRRGELFAPIHWNGETASLARIGSLVHAVCDRHSGQPDLKATPVAIAPASFAFEGFMLSRAAVSLPQDFWWARATVESGIATRLAANIAFDGLAGLARHLLGDDGAVLEFHDNTRQVVAPRVSAAIGRGMPLACSRPKVSAWTGLNDACAAAPQ